MRIIINGDDLCLNPDATYGIIEAFKRGYIDQTTALISSPGNLKIALNLLKENNLMDKVGLHLSLTYGIVNTQEMKLCHGFCRDNKFLYEFAFNERRSLFLTHKEKIAVNKELQYQINLFKNAGFTLMHVDSHGHIHNYPSISKIAIKLAKDNGFNSMRISLNMHKKTKNKLRKNQLNKKLAKEFKTVVYCCNADEFVIAKKDQNATYEIMVHPVMKDGVLINKGSKVSFEELMQSIGSNERITYRDL